jgi:hypothetical protein
LNPPFSVPTAGGYSCQSTRESLVLRNRCQCQLLRTIPEHGGSSSAIYIILGFDAEESHPRIQQVDEVEREGEGGNNSDNCGDACAGLVEMEDSSEGEELVATVLIVG